MFPSKKEQHSVIAYLVAEGLGFHEMHQRMRAVYGEHALSLTRLHGRNKQFHNRAG